MILLNIFIILVNDSHETGKEAPKKEEEDTHSDRTIAY